VIMSASSMAVIDRAVEVPFSVRASGAALREAARPALRPGLTRFPLYVGARVLIATIASRRAARVGSDGSRCTDIYAIHHRADSRLKRQPGEGADGVLSGPFSRIRQKFITDTDMAAVSALRLLLGVSGGCDWRPTCYRPSRCLPVGRPSVSAGSSGAAGHSVVNGSR